MALLNAKIWNGKTVQLGRESLAVGRKYAELCRQIRYGGSPFLWSLAVVITAIRFS
jgi:hypothetical protein